MIISHSVINGLRSSAGDIASIQVLKWLIVIRMIRGNELFGGFGGKQPTEGVPTIAHRHQNDQLIANNLGSIHQDCYLTAKRDSDPRGVLDASSDPGSVAGFCD
jgi:hypothetical protein